MLALRMILEEVKGENLDDEKLMNALVAQITGLDALMDQYKNIYGNWETLKTSVEASHNPDLMLIVDKWQQLQFVTKDFFSRFWKNELPMDKKEKSIMTLKTMTLQGEKLEDPTHEADESWQDSKILEKQYISERELNMAKKVDLQDATVGVEVNVEFVHPEVTIERSTHTDMDPPVHNARNIQIRRTSDDGGVHESGWEDTVSFETYNMNQAQNKNDETTFDECTVETTNTQYGTNQHLTASGNQNTNARGVSHVPINSSSLQETQEFFEEGLMEEGGFDTTVGFFGRRASQAQTESAEFGYATMTRTAETEQIQVAELEVNKTFIIRSVSSPYDGSTISLQEAIVEGFIRPTHGDYYNPRTNQSIPIPEAMSKGLIKVSFTTTKRGQEKRSSAGIITVKTTREPNRPYSIIHVTDLLTNEKINPHEASKRGILHETRGIYIDRRTMEKMLVADAIEKTYVEVEYTGKAPEPEVISKTYAVRAVVDTRLNKIVTFAEAVRRGIIDKESGAYRNTKTGDTMYVGDAIMRGFLKARKIDGPASLNIDPNNKMMVDKTADIIRKKVLRPLKVISAFKQASKLSHLTE